MGNMWIILSVKIVENSLEQKVNCDTILNQNVELLNVLNAR